MAFFIRNILLLFYFLLFLTACGGGGSSAISELPPTVLFQPVNATIISGDNATFTVSASGTGLSYQWQVDNGSGIFSSISDSSIYSGVNASTLIITNVTNAINNSKYRVIVNGSIAPPVISNDATLTIIPTKAILKISVAQVPAGTSVGGIQSEFTLPAGTFLATGPTGEISSGIVTLSGVANGSLAIPTYNQASRLIRFAIVNATGFSNGEILTIIASITPGTTVKTSDFPVATETSPPPLQIIDSSANPITGATCPMTVALQ